MTLTLTVNIMTSYL